MLKIVVLHSKKGLEVIQTRSFGTYLVVTFKGQLAFQVIPLIAPRASLLAKRREFYEFFHSLGKTLRYSTHLATDVY